MMTSVDNRKPFDFEYWRTLAVDDPALFEIKRREALDAVINSAPTSDLQERLNRLQWRVDMERRRCTNPTQACIRIYSMMWKRVYGDGGLLEALNSLLHHGDESKIKKVAKQTPRESAEVLSFRLGSS
ncbi:MAG: hypothetical protein FD130_216 [Halothiobacillaceae bacterium]|nr:MAG: hypothetical protein FD130_216 [Halothiobacillaceae bacterium]